MIPTACKVNALSNINNCDLMGIKFFFRCKSLQTPANMLIINLAVSDFIMLAKASVFIYNSYYLGPALGKLGMTFYIYNDLMLL